MSELSTLTDLIAKGGFPLIIAFLIYGGQKGWYVWGSTHRQTIADKDNQIAILVKDRDDWREASKMISTDTMALFERALRIAKGIVPASISDISERQP